jgi:hypothetical protein
MKMVLLEDINYIALKSVHGITGNFSRLPDSLLSKSGWAEVYLEPEDQKLMRHLYVRSLQYPDGSVLLVGYDLGEVDAIKRALPEKLFENIELSLLLALLTSLGKTASWYPVAGKCPARIYSHTAFWSGISISIEVTVGRFHITPGYPLAPFQVSPCA